MNRVFAFIPLIGFAAMAVYFWMGLQQDQRDPVTADR